MNVMTPNHGSWRPSEHTSFKRAILSIGWGNWKLISEQAIPSRTKEQIKSHAQKYAIHHPECARRLAEGEWVEDEEENKRDVGHDGVVLVAAGTKGRKKKQRAAVKKGGAAIKTKKNRRIKPYVAIPPSRPTLAALEGLSTAKVVSPESTPIVVKVTSCVLPPSFTLPLLTAVVPNDTTNATTKNSAKNMYTNKPVIPVISMDTVKECIKKLNSSGKQFASDVNGVERNAGVSAAAATLSSMGRTGGIIREEGYFDIHRFKSEGGMEEEPFYSAHKGDDTWGVRGNNNTSPHLKAVEGVDGVKMGGEWKDAWEEAAVAYNEDAPLGTPAPTRAYDVNNVHNTATPAAFSNGQVAAPGAAMSTPFKNNSSPPFVSVQFTHVTPSPAKHDFDSFMSELSQDGIASDISNDGILNSLDGLSLNDNSSIMEQDALDLINLTDDGSLELDSVTVNVLMAPVQVFSIGVNALNENSEEDEAVSNNVDINMNSGYVEDIFNPLFHFKSRDNGSISSDTLTRNKIDPAVLRAMIHIPPATYKEILAHLTSPPDFNNPTEYVTENNGMSRRALEDGELMRGRIKILLDFHLQGAWWRDADYDAEKEASSNAEVEQAAEHLIALYLAMLGLETWHDLSNVSANRILNRQDSILDITHLASGIWARIKRSCSRDGFAVLGGSERCGWVDKAVEGLITIGEGDDIAYI